MSGNYTTLFQIYIALSILLDISAITLNGLVGYVLKKHKKTSIITFWFLYCLSVSDVMVGVTGLAYHLLRLMLSPQRGRPSSNVAITVTGVFLHYFFVTSGNLLFIIAVDRCIHMKYLNKYSSIMTQFRARLIMLFCILFGILITIPIFALSETFRASYNVGVNVFRTTFTLLIYVIYMKTYFSIRRQLAALKLGKTNNTALLQEPDNITKVQRKLTSSQQCSSFSKVKVDLVMDSVRSPNSSLSRALTREDEALQSQSYAFVPPKCPAACLPQLTDNKENTDDRRVILTISRLNQELLNSDHIKNYSTCRVINIIAKSDKAKETRQTTTSNKLKLGMNQKSKLRKVIPEQDFRRAIIFMFLALFICYLPYLAHKFYFFATESRNAVVSVMAAVGVLLNSSLNAIILIACNKELQRNITVIFAKR